MKKFATLLTLVLTLILGVQACSDDSNSPNDNPGSLTLGTLKATVGGSEFSSQQAMGIKMGSQVTVNGTRLVNNFQGAESISLVIANAKVGTNNAVGFFSYTPNSGQPSNVTTWSSDVISVEITSMTTTELQGRFSFVGENTKNSSDKKEVKNGAFRVQFSN